MRLRRCVKRSWGGKELPHLATADRGLRAALPRVCSSCFPSRDGMGSRMEPDGSPGLATIRWMCGRVRRAWQPMFCQGVWCRGYGSITDAAHAPIASANAAVALDSVMSAARYAAHDAMSYLPRQLGTTRGSAYPPCRSSRRSP
jgi:hypothetical protein